MGKINSDKEGKATIVKYLTNQNRPYSVNDLVANLHNEISKALMQKSLDTLVEESKVKEKVNGKQKAYFINQDDFPIASEEDLKKLDVECNVVQEELTKLSGQIKIKEEKIRAFNSALTTQEAKKKVKELSEEAEKLQKKLEGLSGQGNMVDQDTMNEAKKGQEVKVKEWRKRKRMFNSISDAILDGYPHPKKQFYEEVGVETDQDVGAKFPDE